MINVLPKFTNWQSVTVKPKLALPPSHGHGHMTLFSKMLGFTSIGIDLAIKKQNIIHIHHVSNFSIEDPSICQTSHFDPCANRIFHLHYP